MRHDLTRTEPLFEEDAITSEDGLENLLLSHDIRSAVSQIIHAGQALEAGENAGEQAVFVRQINAAALYINDLLSSLQTPDALDPVSEIEPMMQHLEAVWGPEASDKGIGFEVERCGRLPGSLHLPRIEFLRIFNNIIGNSLKFSEKGTLKLRLACQEDGALVFELVDSGPGFSKDALKRLFSLRGRPDDSAKDGFGFGLYIARELVEKSGGAIHAENRPSGGARLLVSFPESLCDSPEKPAPKPVSGLPDLSHLDILLAEDNPTNQLVASQMLKKMGARVDTADDGVLALSGFENGHYNLGLLDIEMPRKSGLEVMREMRARTDEKAKIALLALTAYVLPEHRDRIMAAGADGIIAKPLTDLSAFGNAILAAIGSPETRNAESPIEPTANADAEIQMEVYDGLKNIIGADSMRELLGKVQSDLMSVRDGLEEGAAAKDEGPIRANTHILISVAGAFGAVNLQHLAESLNATAKTGNWEAILSENVRCIKGISDVLTFVNAELEK